MLNAPEKLSLARLSTPLQPLRRLSQSLGGPTIWVKRDDLTGTIETGNKIRKLEYVFADAIAQGCSAVITAGGTQSNHCRATAVVAASLGLDCHLILREDTKSSVANGNLLLDQLLGAAIEIYPRHGFGIRLAQRFQDKQKQIAEQGKKAYAIPVGASDGVGLWGYINAASELNTDFEAHSISPKAIVFATGSAGTQGGLTLGTQLLHMPQEVIGIAVCDDADYFYHKVIQDWQHWQQRYGTEIAPDRQRIITLDDYIGPAYGVADAPVYEMIRHVAATEGIVLDPTYTGKAFYGLVQEILKGRFGPEDDVVFIHTGGVYGLLAQAEQSSGYVAPLNTLRNTTE